MLPCRPYNDMANRPKETLQHFLITVMEEGRNLTKWEQDFVGSLSDQWERVGSMSEKQAEILERIYAEKT